MLHKDNSNCLLSLKPSDVYSAANQSGTLASQHSSSSGHGSGSAVSSPRTWAGSARSPIVIQTPSTPTLHKVLPYTYSTQAVVLGFCGLAIQINVELRFLPILFTGQNINIMKL